MQSLSRRMEKKRFEQCLLQRSGANAPICCSATYKRKFLTTFEKVTVIAEFLNIIIRLLMEVAILGGGCFWCVEAMLQKLKGVSKVTPGYCGGPKDSPSYKEVKTGETGHIEVVEVIFDPKIISYETLLTVFMHIHDPTQSDGQGEDIGSQYISAIFTTSQDQYAIATKVIKHEQESVASQGKKIYTIIREDGKFFQAEDYHHNYFNIRGQDNPYCSIIPPKIAKMKHLFKDLVQEP